MVRFDRRASVDAVVAALDEHGYAIVERLLPVDQVSRARNELALVLPATPLGRNDFEGYCTRRVYALFAKIRAFDEPATHPLVLGVLDSVLGERQSGWVPTCSSSGWLPRTLAAPCLRIPVRCG